jgi:NADH-quinone oxidoreductase subunit M
MIIFPFLGAGAQALDLRASVLKWLALGASIISAILGVLVLGHNLAGLPVESLLDQLPWVGSYAINYELSVDGISMVPVLIASVIFPVLLASEWDRREGARGLHALLLILQGALLGAVCSQDLFLMFFFWSLSSLPIFFLTGIWGGSSREQSAFRTLVTAAVGNSLLFGALILIYYSKDPHTDRKSVV